jgi:hypothetical protein
VSFGKGIGEAGRRNRTCGAAEVNNSPAYPTEQSAEITSWSVISCERARMSPTVAALARGKGGAYISWTLESVHHGSDRMCEVGQAVAVDKL